MDIKEYGKFKHELEQKVEKDLAALLGTAAGEFEAKTGVQVANLSVTLSQSVRLGPDRIIDGHLLTDVDFRITSTLEKPRG